MHRPGKRQYSQNLSPLLLDLDESSAKIDQKRRCVFRKLESIPRGTSVIDSQLFSAYLEGAPFGIEGKIKLDVPNCAVVYQGPWYKANTLKQENTRLPGDPPIQPLDCPIQFLAAGFKLEPQARACISLLRKLDIRNKTAELILLPWFDFERGSRLYGKLMTCPNYQLTPEYCPDLPIISARLGSYPIRSEAVKELETQLRKST